ncbi:MAG: HAD family hydrolase [Desulfurivibrio sp.]|nr:HAD family hydrolase [Desulfurivibrio sp.]
MSEIKLVIFDCDGVMFDSREANRAYYNHLRTHFGQPPLDEEELSYVHMQHVAESVRFLFREQPVKLAAVERYRHQLDYTPFLQYMRMEPDLPTFLEWLQPRCKTAISTNRTSTLSLVLARHQLEGCFDQVVTARDVANPKPHPEALEKILGQLQIPRTAAIYIGDSQVDREHTAAAGIPLIAFKNPALAAEYHVESFMEITALPPFTTA